MNEAEFIVEQRAVCERFQAPFYGCDLSLKVGVSKNIRSGARPINALRINPTDEASGWFIWAGESWSDEDDFFAPLHGDHLNEWIPLILPYLGLPPGWRVLVTESQEDVWEDRGLLRRKDH
jgi:hypothetical protein